MEPIKPCENCQKATPNKRFCSNACHLAGTSEQRAASRRKPRLPCAQCGGPSKSRRSIYCSRTCSSVARRKPESPCARCGSTERGSRRRQGKYCSFNCFNEDRYEKTGGFARWVADWLEGGVSGTTSNGEPDHRIGLALRTVRGSVCEECGWSKRNPVSGQVPLHVDHVDGDRSKNRPSDLKLLCPNCHSLTPTYQHLNNRAVSPTRKVKSRRYLETCLSSTA